MTYSKTFEGVAGKIAFSLNRDLDEDEVALFEQKMIDLVEGFKLDLHGNIPGDCKPAVGTRAYKLAKQSSYEGRYVFDTANKPEKTVYQNMVLFFAEEWQLSLLDTKKKIDAIFYAKAPLALNWNYIGVRDGASWQRNDYRNRLVERKLIDFVTWEERQQSDDEQFKYYV